MTRARKRAEQGQVSIFLAITLLIVITFLAFVINVGLFVKAKINLQNAVDAAAWAGAAVQARQLTNIAWLNWEMRNTYKEWMFKYYVLGNLTRNRLKPPLINNSPRTNFRLNPFYFAGEDNYKSEVYDRFNVPTICIHFGTAADICDTTDIPGIPRFNSLGLPSISEHAESLINAIASEKASDCSNRTDVNFGAAMLWAYGTGHENFLPNIPQLASHRPGAWTESVELALRMRNLEMMVNLPPLESICADPSGGIPCLPIAEVEGKSQIPLYERPVKAFWSAFRNLGGGRYKESAQNQDSYTKTFTLTELAPTPFQAPQASLSGFLIPPGNALQKHYIDLQAYSLNLSTFYTTFTSITERFKAPGIDTDAEAGCAGTKTALPVPGYIMGFVKNPAVMTYYAVKGTARYTGLFFPFAETDGIEMSAYATAKPFGGRIGPRLFSIDPGGNLVRPRNEPTMSRTGPYVSGFDIESARPPGGGWEPFLPLPFDSDFWVIENRPLGGTPLAGGEIFFGIPNLLYDFENMGDIAPMDSGNIIEILRAAGTEALARSTDETMGLYDSHQYQLFRANLVDRGSSVVLTPEDVEISLNNARSPTRYEALNYLIPTLGNSQNDGLESPHLVTSSNPTDSTKGTINLFAPLFGQDTLFQDINTITNIIGSYLEYNEPATEKYLASLKRVAEHIRSQRTRGTQGYRDAANTIYQEPLALAPPLCDNPSMAQVFNQYFNGTSTQCEIVPLKERLRIYFNDRLSDVSGGGDAYQYFYSAPYTRPTGSLDNTQMRGAYFPGPRQGATPEGELLNPFISDAPLAKRNYYSTKLFAIEKIGPSGNHSYDNRIPLYLEKGNTGETPTDPGSTSISTTPCPPSNCQNLAHHFPIESYLHHKSATTSDSVSGRFF